MKIVLQRVKNASVEIENRTVGEIGVGYLLLVGLEKGDDSRFFQPMADKIGKIKLFPDDNGRFAYSIKEIEGELLVISQFTLFADLKKGKKPSLSRALSPDLASTLFEEFVGTLKKEHLPVKEGEFGAMMQVKLQNDGPVTIILDSKELFPSLY